MPAERSKPPGFFCDVERQFFFAQQAFQPLVFLFERFNTIVAKEAGKLHTGAVLLGMRARLPLQELRSLLVEQTFGDAMSTGQFSHRLFTAQDGEHDLSLKFR